jgi:hypothetical protein
LALVFALYVVGVLLPLLHLTGRVPAGSPLGVPRTCADEQLRRRGSLSATPF